MPHTTGPRRIVRECVDMCGCRWCIEMRLFQDALNAERAVLAIKHDAAPYTAPYTHDKPRQMLRAAW